MADPVARIQVEIARLKRELQELETAVNVLRRFGLIEGTGPEHPKGSSRDNDLAGATIRDAAIKVLSAEGGAHIDYREVAQKAVALGYRSRTAGSDIKTISKSFLDTMRRDGMFRKRGSAFRLAASAMMKAEQGETIANGRAPSNAEVRANAIASIIKDLKHPATIPELIAILREKNVSLPDEVRNSYNIVYSTLNNKPHMFKAVKTGVWDLAEQDSGT
jgi:hypothetical protein